MKKEEIGFPFFMYAKKGTQTLINTHYQGSLMQFVEVLRGEVAVQIGTESVPAKSGDFVYIPPMVVTKIDAVSDNASIRGMVFDTAILEANMENFDSEVFYMFYLQSKNKVAPFTSGHPVYDTLKKYMQESYDEYVGKDVCYKLPIRANIYLMMTALLRYYCGSKDESDRMIYHNVLRLRPVIEYISEHCCEKIYIDKLSEMINVSSDYFTKMFKDSIGKTPIEYINGLRVNESMRLLSETEKTMAEIADEIGFCNPNYFHKIFKQYIGVSPLAFRKSSK
jgi:AraC-like DNA-binding protein